jgi:cytochrome o ubiquinol oxidase subunit II
VGQPETFPVEEGNARERPSCSVHWLPFQGSDGGGTWKHTLVQLRMNRRAPLQGVRSLGTKFRTRLAALFATLLCGCGSDRHLSFLNPQGPIAAIQRGHFFEVLTVLAVLVAMPIFLLTPWFAWRYRYGAKTSRYTPKWDSFWPLELATWGGPVVIVVVLAFILWRDTHAIDPYKPLISNQPALRIQVIGYDWKWLFIYPDQGVASIGVLAIPAGRPLALQLTSATVMQSLLIPALGSQIYAMGGMVTQLHLQATKPGRFMGENTMFSGRGFHQQQFTAVAMTHDGFQAWVRNVQLHGIPMNEQTLKAISQRSTRSELIAALPRAKSSDGNVYLTGVTAALFPTVVKATMGGTAIDLANAGARTPGGARANPLPVSGVPIRAALGARR